MNEQSTWGQQRLEPQLAACAAQWAHWGVALRVLRGYSRAPRRYRLADNPDYDCAWGCFFERMGWLDDIEGTFRAYVMLYDMERYIARSQLEAAKIAASRCIYVNFPHRPPAGAAPDCQQAKLLKDCFILETIQNVTAEDKFQFIELLHDWAWICAETWNVPLELLRQQVQQRWPAEPIEPTEPTEPTEHTEPTTPTQIIYTSKYPPEVGCVWRCLFYDMGWIGPRLGMFVPSVVQETIKLYYDVEDKIPQLVDVATRCVKSANKVLEDDNDLPNGCGRSGFLVDCLLRGFFNKNAVSIE